jgi:hypothetical protein
VVDAAPHRCCRRPDFDAAVAADSCCSSADAGTDLASDGCESPSAQGDPCGCDLVPRDEAPAVPVRTEPDVRADAEASAHGFHASAIEDGRMPVAIDGPVLPAALALARELAARHPRAVSHVKRLVRMAASQGLDAGLAAERTLFCDLLVDADSIALMARMNAGELPITGPGPA